MTGLNYLIIFGLLLASPNVLSAGESEDIAIVLKAKGDVKIQNANPGGWHKVERGMHLNSGDMIKTEAGGFAAIMFTDDKSLLKVRENSTITMNGKRQNTAISKKLKLPVGELWLKVKKQKTQVKVETPTGVAAVKGTEFYTLVDGAGNTTLYGIEGVVSLKNNLGAVDVKAGQTGLSTKDRAPSSHKSIEAQIPKWAHVDKTEEEVKIEFEDGEGNKKTLKIIFEDE